MWSHSASSKPDFRPEHAFVLFMKNKTLWGYRCEENLFLPQALSFLVKQNAVWNWCKNIYTVQNLACKYRCCVPDQELQWIKAENFPFQPRKDFLPMETHSTVQPQTGVKPHRVPTRTILHEVHGLSCAFSHKTSYLKGIYLAFKSKNHALHNYRVLSNVQTDLMNKKGEHRWNMGDHLTQPNVNRHFAFSWTNMYITRVLESN